MRLLVPIDGSDCSTRALAFACEFAERFDADVDVVHFTDEETSATEQLVAHAREVLAEHGTEASVETLSDRDVSIRTGDRVGDEIIALVEERGYDHVVMGHHGSGRVERAILGSAAEVVLRAESVAVTVVP
jgi:nucleotide-binding universal stress UspA family protein